MDDELMAAQRRLLQIRARMRAGSPSQSDKPTGTRGTRLGSSAAPVQSPEVVVQAISAFAEASGGAWGPTPRIVVPGEPAPEFECQLHGVQRATRRARPQLPGLPQGDAWAFVCHACKAEEAEARRLEQEKRRQALAARLIAAAGTLEWPDRGLDDLVRGACAPAIDAARRLLRGQIPGLYLWGNTGVGKSTVAEAIVVESCRAGRGSLIMTPGQMVRASRPDSEWSRTHGDVFEHAERVPLLVLDNLEGYDMTDRSESNMQDLLVTRFKRGSRCCTVFTSILSPDRQAEQWGRPAIASRWNGWGEVVQIRGSDRRGMIGHGGR